MVFWVLLLSIPWNDRPIYSYLRKAILENQVVIAANAYIADLVRSTSNQLLKPVKDHTEALEHRF